MSWCHDVSPPKYVNFCNSLPIVASRQNWGVGSQDNVYKLPSSSSFGRCLWIYAEYTETTRNFTLSILQIAVQLSLEQNRTQNVVLITILLYLAPFSILTSNHKSIYLNASWCTCSQSWGKVAREYSNNYLHGNDINSSTLPLLLSVRKASKLNWASQLVSD